MLQMFSLRILARFIYIFCWNLQWEYIRNHPSYTEMENLLVFRLPLNNLVNSIFTEIELAGYHDCYLTFYWLCSWLIIHNNLEESIDQMKLLAIKVDVANAGCLHTPSVLIDQSRHYCTEFRFPFKNRQVLVIYINRH